MEEEKMVEEERILMRSNSWIDRLVVCKDCKHVAMDQQRHNQHLQEARHINTLRNMAYRFPLKRSFWLSIWFTCIERVERENPWALAFHETEENFYLENLS
eukprot:TRINITY_DN20051_c0_g1_i1.p2 TRINITY_DN20051_c0_g1~~TRINITY_DN20051_c0_g1_i1.p2  ORF type:complete len:101 (-),score=42.49 TRINITY_DN20051_c0_g1_i1:89-391(-)